MNNKKKNSAARTALAGMLAALSAVVLIIGAYTGVMDLTGICIASGFTAIAVVELGGMYPYLIWAVVSIIAFILLPDKSIVAAYTLFGGIYPVLKLYFERLSRVFEWVAKILYGVAVLGVLYVLSKFVFGIPDEGKVLTVILAVGYALVFVLYDYTLSVAMTLYMRRLRPKLTFLKKL